MLYLVSRYDTLCLWWDKRSEFKDGYKYKVIVDDKQVVFTTQVYYDLKCIEPGTEHKLTVQLVDENKNVIGKTETITGKTLPKKTIIDISKPPYNAIGDGETDCTEIFQKAINDCTESNFIFVPFGIYVCSKLSMSGDKKIQFAAGATICNKETVKKL